MRATGCCSAQPLLMASWADSGGSAACRLPSRMGWMWANSRPIMNASWDRSQVPPAATKRELQERRWRSDAPLHQEGRRPSGLVRPPSRAVGSAPVGCAGWWAWFWDGTRSSSARRFRSSLVYTFLQISRMSCEHSTKTRWYTLQVPFAALQGRSCAEHSWPGLTTSSVVILHQPHYGGVQTSVARHYLSATEIQRVASVVCELPPGLLEYHTSRSQIPWPDASLVVAVYPP